MIAAAASQGTTSASASSSCPANKGLKTVGPRIAPKTAPKRTSEIPRARRSGGYMSPAAVRASSAMPCAPPIAANPVTSSTAESIPHASAVTQHPAIPSTKPPASTGTRPTRSISRPAGIALSAPASRKIAGPRPRIPSIPVTSTSDVVATATPSWSIPERHVSEPASRTVFRATG